MNGTEKMIYDPPSPRPRGVCLSEALAMGVAAWLYCRHRRLDFQDIASMQSFTPGPLSLSLPSELCFLQQALNLLTWLWLIFLSFPNCLASALTRFFQTYLLGVEDKPFCSISVAKAFIISAADRERFALLNGFDIRCSVYHYIVCGHLGLHLFLNSNQTQRYRT